MHEDSSKDENETNVSVLKKLPKDLSIQLGSLLDYNTLSVIPSVSKEWHSLFSHPSIWKHKLITDFHIPASDLNKFIAMLPPEIDTLKIYKTIYKNLIELSKKEQFMLKPIFLSYAARNTENLFNLLACCSNDPDIFIQIVPKEERLIWLQMILYSPDNTIFKSLIKNPQHFFKIDETINLNELWLCMASRAANETAMNFLLNKENGFVFDNFKSLLERAINNALYANGTKLWMKLDDLYLEEFKDSFICNEYHIVPEAVLVFFGNVNLIKQFINTDLGEKQPVRDLFLLCLFANNKELIDYFINPLNQTGIVIDSSALLTAVFVAYTSGSTEVLYQLVSAMSHEQLQAIVEPNLHGLLYCAAHRGDLRLVKYLIEQHTVQPDQEILDVARDPNVMAYLLNTIEKLSSEKPTATFDICQPNVSASFSILVKTHDIKPTQKILNDVASYSLADVQFILDKKHGFNLVPNEETLLSAIQEFNMPVVRYLLDPAQQFYLRINEKTIEKAVQSQAMKSCPLLEHNEEYFSLTNVIKSAIVDILRCEIILQTIMEKLKQNNFACLEEDLKLAKNLSESHTLKFVTHVTQRPDIYDLNQCQLKFINDYQISSAPPQRRLTQ